MKVTSFGIVIWQSMFECSLIKIFVCKIVWGLLIVFVHGWGWIKYLSEADFLHFVVSMECTEQKLFGKMFPLNLWLFFDMHNMLLISNGNSIYANYICYKGLSFVSGSWGGQQHGFPVASTPCLLCKVSRWILSGIGFIQVIEGFNLEPHFLRWCNYMLRARASHFS